MNQAIRSKIEKINNGIVPEGYKQTEIGIVPEAWEFKKISEFAKVCMCKRIFSFQTKEIGDIPFYKIGTFGKIADAYIDKELYYDYRQRFSYPTIGDVLFSAAGTLGRTVVFDGKDSYFQDSNIVWLHIDKRQIINEYLYHYYQVIKWASSEGSTISRLYNEIIYDTDVIFPKDIVEQSKIAEILMKWDEMVELQEQYIQKLELRKKAVMKKLLTPKDGWKKCKLNDFIKVKSGYAFKSETYVEDGKYQILTIKNVQRGLLDLNEISTISELPSNIQKHQILALGDIIISLTGNVGRSCYITKENCLLNQRVGKVECSSEYKQFVYAILQTDNFINAMINIAQGGAQANLSNEDVENFEIFVPFEEGSIDEKTIYKLGKIHLIIDEEISLQKEKLEKIKIQRKAMQQYLLSGIVRVV